MTRLPSRRIEIPGQRARRVLFFALVGGTGLGGAVLMFDIVGRGGLTLLEVLILALFVPTFVWISISFWNAVIGFVLLLTGLHPLTLSPFGRTHERGEGQAAAEPPRTRTALVVPARHEPMGRVLAGLRGMLGALETTGHGAAFDLHLLSDTTDPERAKDEEAAWEAFRREHAGATGLHYRRRRTNEGRKAGNIGEFCRRSVGRYEHMVVLDADSIMSAETLLELVRTMEANPRAGLIQTVPLPARQATPFGRLVQFAATLYSRLLATGQSFWQGDAANYWGHNAIVRLDVFERHARLPTLPGRPPLGGEILSHDFVEAALIRRAGWHVYLLPELEGSYEEVPGNVPDFAARDRRWAQGSLQHLRLLGLDALHPLSRVHFVLGAMGYVSSVLWFALLLAGSAYVLWPAASGGPVLAGGAWPWGAGPGDVSRAVPLLGVTAVLLFLPKALGVASVALGGARGFGGVGRLLAGAAIEALFAIVIAPVMMMYHVRAVLGVLMGRDVAWGAHTREGRRVSWSEALRGTAWIAAVGLVWAVVTALISPPFLAWLAPILAGLVLVAPIVRWTSLAPHEDRSRAPGSWLAVPQETRPSRELLGASRPWVPGQGRPSGEAPAAAWRTGRGRHPAGAVPIAASEPEAGS